MNESNQESSSSSLSSSSSSLRQLVFPSPASLTVWRQSLVFNGDGYTVYDNSNGQILFRVENYARGRKDDVVVMDFSGEVLLTIRRCRKHKLSIGKTWEVYKGDLEVLEKKGNQSPLFRATKALGLRTSKCTIKSGDMLNNVTYKVAWSDSKDWLKIYKAGKGKFCVAEVSKKLMASSDAFLGKDVLHLQVEPGLDQTIPMAIIIVTDAMR